MNRPNWHNDYDMDASGFALSAESFVDGMPLDIDELKKRQGWPMWQQAIREELGSLELINT